MGQPLSLWEQGSHVGNVTNRDLYKRQVKGVGDMAQFLELELAQQAQDPELHP